MEVHEGEGGKKLQNLWSKTVAVKEEYKMPK